MATAQVALQEKQIFKDHNEIFQRRAFAWTPAQEREVQGQELRSVASGYFDRFLWFVRVKTTQALVGFNGVHYFVVGLNGIY